MKPHPLKSFRDSRGMTQAELAVLLGVARTTVARWEINMRQIGHESVLGIAEKTGISPSELRPDLAGMFLKPMQAAE